MKYQLKIYVGLSFLILLSSCKGFLDETPESFLSPTTFFNSERNIEVAVNGVYDVLGARGLGAGLNFGNYNQGLLFMGEHGTDQMRAPNDDPSNRFHQLDLYAYTSSADVPTQVWRAHYVGINRANTVISRVELLLDDPEFNHENLLRYIAEVRFLRALYYFNLVRFYGAVPLKLTETASLTANDVVSIARSPEIDVYEQIEQDLLFAQEHLLMPSVLADTENGRVTKTAAWSLLSRVYLTWAGYPLKDESKWEQAANYAKKVIDSGEHSLMADYVNVFGVVDRSTEVNPEIIYAVKFSNVTGEGCTLGIVNGIIGLQGANAKIPGISASDGTIRVEEYYYNSFDPDDQRRDWTCSAFRVRPDGSTVPLNPNQMEKNIGMAKWRRDGSFVGGPNSPYDYPLIRYADVLLMYAEATAQANGAPTFESYEAVNMVRRRAFGKPFDIPDPTIDYSGLSLSEFIDAVLQERSWELCSEDCSRWHDLIRYERLGEVVKAVKRPSVLEYFDESKHKLFPIPLLEMDSNPLVKQNPGY